MLYLAEVDKGFGRRTTLQLLAKQQSENNWTPVYDEAIATEEAAKFNSGVLVLAEITPNRHAQNIREAAKQMVTVLHSLSKLQGKARDREQELQELQDSLTYQIQALNKRQLELEEREDRLQQVDFEALDSQEAHIAQQQQVVGQLREQLNLKESELQQKEQDLELRLQNAHSGLSDEDASKLQTLLGDLEHQLHPPAIAEPMAATQARLQSRWDELDAALSSLEAEREQAQGQQSELDKVRQDWRDRRSAWMQGRTELSDSLAQLRQQESALATSRQHLEALTEYLQRQERCDRQAIELTSTHDFIVATGTAAATPTVSTEDLSATVKQLQQRFDQYAGQVQQQEQELEQNQTTLADLQKKLAAAADNDRFDIEMDIDYAKDACKAFEEALAPQRDRLAQLERELHQQDSVLKMRLGEGGPAIPTVDIGPLVTPMTEQKQAIQADIDRLTASMQDAEATVAQLQDSTAARQQDLDDTGTTLEAEETALLERTQAMAETWGRLNHRSELLQTEREWLQSLQQSAESLAGAVAELNGKSESGRAQLAQARELISSWG